MLAGERRVTAEGGRDLLIVYIDAARLWYNQRRGQALVIGAGPGMVEGKGRRLI